MLTEKLSASTVPVDADLNTHLVHMMEEGSKSITENFGASNVSSGNSSARLLTSQMHGR